LTGNSKKYFTLFKEPGSGAAALIEEAEEEAVLQLLDDGGIVFKRESGRSLRSRFDEDDDFFEITVEDVVKMQVPMIYII
jgi:hypothetical protein